MVITHLNRNQNDRHGSNRRYACCQAVQTVNQIDNVRKADNPENCQRYRNKPFVKIKIAAEGIVQPFDTDIEGHKYAGSKNLPQQLDLCRQLIFVIQYAYDGNHAAAKQNADNILRQLQACHCGNHKGNINSQTAKTRHNLLMHLAVIGLVNRADFKG